MYFIRNNEAPMGAPPPTHTHTHKQCNNARLHAALLDGKRGRVLEDGSSPRAQAQLCPLEPQLAVLLGRQAVPECS